MTLPNFTKDAERAEQVLRDAITASGLPAHTAVALWCAVDSLVRARVRRDIADAVSKCRSDPTSLGPN